jgi:hypothetical protein
LNGEQGLGRDLPTVKAASAAATTGAGDDSSEISDMTALREQQLEEDNDNNRPTTAQTGTEVSNYHHCTVQYFSSVVVQ